MRKTTIFFDFDGVILESANIKTDAFMDLFSDYPDKLAAIRQIHVENMGVSRFRKFEWIYNQLLGQSLSQEESMELGARFTELTFQKILDSPFVPGAKDLLDGIRNRIANFVVSGTPQDELISIIQRRSLSDYFVEIRGAPDTKSEILEKLVLTYDLRAEECLFVGDAQTDYEAATFHNIDFVARQTDELKQFWLSKNVKTVDNLMDVRHYLGW